MAADLKLNPFAPPPAPPDRQAAEYAPCGPAGVGERLLRIRVAALESENRRLRHELILARHVGDRALGATNGAKP